MAGRPKKKPEYNPELQFNNFLQELRDAYEEADSLRTLADELNISLLKLRKLLITADVFTSDINHIRPCGKGKNKMEEIVKSLKEAETYYLATVEGDQPRVRPFGTAHIFEGKLYIQTGKNDLL